MTHTNHVIKSERLGKDVNVRVYGTKGYPVIAFPTQDQMADEWEANGMTEVFAPYVDAGRVQLFTVDSNDLESWSNPSDDFAARIGRQEDYYNFVCDELLPFVHQANGSRLRPELTGASLGATQATICALRRPDLFQGVIALSGMYHTSYFFGDWGNDISYANDVNAFLPNTPLDHPYIELYRQRTFAFAIGQADDEQFGVSDLHFLQQTFDRLGISGWFDFWGPESNHDWYWWKQQMAKFLPEAVKELEGVAAAEPELAKAEPKKHAAPAKKPSRAAAAKADKPAAAPKTEASEAKKATTAVKASATKEVAAEKASAPKTKAETAAKKAETAAKEAEPKKTAPAKKVAAATAQAKVAPAKKATTAKPAPVADVKDTAKKAATPAKKATATKVSASKSGSASKASAANKPAAKTTTRKRSATSKSSTSARKTTKKSAK